MELGGSRITHYSRREMSKMWGLKYVITDNRRGYKCLQKVKFGCKCAASLMSHLAIISYMCIFTFSELQVIIKPSQHEGLLVSLFLESFGPFYVHLPNQPLVFVLHVLQYCQLISTCQYLSVCVSMCQYVSVRVSMCQYV